MKGVLAGLTAERKEEFADQKGSSANRDPAQPERQLTDGIQDPKESSAIPAIFFPKLAVIDLTTLAVGTAAGFAVGVGLRVIPPAGDLLGRVGPGDG